MASINYIFDDKELLETEVAWALKMPALQVQELT